MQFTSRKGISLQLKRTVSKEQSNLSHSRVKKKQAALNSNITKMFQKFSSLNNSYQIETDYHHFEVVEGGRKLNKNMKINNFTIMAKLRHLENMSEISKVEHQMDLRRTGGVRRNIRKEKKWEKHNQEYNKPYICTYRNFLKESIQTGLFEKNETSEDQFTEPDQDNEEDSSFLDKIKYKDSLKPYKSILMYTKQKLEQKQKVKTETSVESRKKRIVNENKNKNLDLCKEYNDLANKCSNALNTERSVKEEALKIVNKSIKKIIKRKQSRIQCDEKNECNDKVSKFVEKQCLHLEENEGLSNNSKIKIKKRIYAVGKQLFKNQSGRKERVQSAYVSSSSRK